MEHRGWRAEPSTKQDELARRVIGTAIEVHRILGPGFIEAVYEEALCIELGLRGIPYQRQVAVSVDYKGQRISNHYVDILVDEQLIVELKAVDTLASLHVAQLLTYLKASRCKLGLLINFNVPLLRNGIRRVVHTL